MEEKSRVHPPPYATQPGDVWERYGKRTVVTGRDANWPGIITIDTGDPTVWKDVEQMFVQCHILVERNGKPVNPAGIQERNGDS